MGKGSKFTLFLLRLLLQGEPGSVQACETAAPEEKQSLKILVVDDNVDAATMLAMLLDAFGRIVAVEYTSHQALKRAQKEQPHVCLLDIGLPDIDGLELARQLRAQPETANAVLIAVTGYGKSIDRRKTRDAGFDHHLVKPVDGVELAAILDQVIASQALVN